MKGFERQKQSGKSRLTVLSFAAIIYFFVAGGPFSTEDAIKAAGALPVLLGVVVLTLIWAIPEAMVTAELATAFPEDSGYVAWCSVAFSPFWGFLNGFLSLINVVLNNAAFLIVIVHYLAQAIPALQGGWTRVLFLLAVAFLLTALNYLGLEFVGWGQMVNLCLVMAPFLVLAGFCWSQGDIRNLGKAQDHIDWSMFINIMFWNLNYWSLGANLAGEVDNPGYTFPRSLALAVVGVMLSYLIPIASAASVDTNYSQWGLGYYAQIASRVGGQWLGSWVVVAAIIGQTGLYWSSLSAGSYLSLGMAERGFLPAVFEKRSRFGTPILGVWLQVLPSWGLSMLNWSAVLGMVNVTFALTVMMALAAHITLRIKQPQLPRPYRMPGNLWVAVAIISPGFALLVWVVLIPFYSLQWQVIICVLAALALGGVLYPLLQSRGWRRRVRTHDLVPMMLHKKAVGQEGVLMLDGEGYKALQVGQQPNRGSSGHV